MTTNEYFYTHDQSAKLLANIYRFISNFFTNFSMPEGDIFSSIIIVFGILSVVLLAITFFKFLRS